MATLNASLVVAFIRDYENDTHRQLQSRDAVDLYNTHSYTCIFVKFNNIMSQLVYYLHKGYALSGHK